MNKRILALDMATQCGWAYLANGITTSGTVGFTRQYGRKTIPDDHLGLAYNDYHSWLTVTIRDYQPDVIAYEEVMRFMSGAASKAFGAWRSMTLQLACKHGIQVMPLSVGTIKKHATGKGNASKEMMIDAAKKAYPDHDIADDNEADALHILALCMHNLR